MGKIGRDGLYVGVGDCRNDMDGYICQIKRHGLHQDNLGTGLRWLCQRMHLQQPGTAKDIVALVSRGSDEAESIAEFRY